MVPEKTFKIPYTDLKIKINKYILQQRQRRWSINNYNKLLEIKPILGEWKQSFRKSRKEEVVLSRLRRGHTRITHSYLLKEEQPICHACQIAYTIKHILIKCIDLAPTSERFYNASCTKELFKKKLKRLL